MVTEPRAWLLANIAAPGVLWAEKDARPLLERLAPPDRAIVLMAILGLLVVGGALIALVIVAGRLVLREARRTHGPTPRYEDHWYRKPLVPPADDSDRESQ